MISRRNYFTITVMMFVVFFLCMFINNLKDAWNDYSVNSYAEDAGAYPSQVNMYLPGSSREGNAADPDVGEIKKAAGSVAARRKVVCISDGAFSDMVREWAVCTKRDMAQYPSLDACTEEEDGRDLPEMLVIDPASIRWDQEKEIESLFACVDQGVHLVFCSLPEVSVIRDNEQVRELLGVRNVAEEETTVDGLHLYSGFLLGGEKVYQAIEERDRKYQDMQLTFPWYRLEAGTKVYMKGIPEDETVKKESYPPLIWRKSFGTAYVFAVNGGYMEGMAGMGILSAMSSEMYSFELYPVVNAQNMVFVGYPSLADENREKMDEHYSRSVKQLFQEVLWPGITTTLQDHEFGLTCMMTPQYDYQDSSLPDPEQFKYYLKIFNEQSVETGLSAFGGSREYVPGKLGEDCRFVQETLDTYRFSSFYAGDLEREQIEEALQEEGLLSVKTVVTDTKDEDMSVVGFLSEEVTEQHVLGDGLDYSFESDFRVRCMETALGYFSVSFDMTRVAYPETEEDLWENLALEFSKTAGAYGEDFQGFEGTTVSECDAHIRRFLGLDYEYGRTEDRILLRTNDTGGTVWFILRTHNEKIKEMEGGDWKELESGAYLIGIEDRDAVITMEPSDHRYYY